MPVGDQFDGNVVDADVQIAREIQRVHPRVAVRGARGTVHPDIAVDIEPADVVCGKAERHARRVALQHKGAVKAELPVFRGVRAVRKDRLSLSEKFHTNLRIVDVVRGSTIVPRTRRDCNRIFAFSQICQRTSFFCRADGKFQKKSLTPLEIRAEM